jgi:hypothetical protein
MRIKSLKEPVSATAVYNKGACHIMYGKVRISAAPAESFSFSSEASWPQESYENAVRRGITDGLAEAGIGTEFGAKFVLEEIEWHEVNSCELGYWEAAKQATQEILRMAGVGNIR